MLPHFINDRTMLSTLHRTLRPHAALALTLLLALGALTACDSAPGGGDPPEETGSTPPAAPAGLAATSGDGEIMLDWNASSESDLDGYNVYRSTSSFAGTDGLAPVNGSVPAGDASLTDTDVQNGTVYYYRVTAVDESGNESSLSGEVSKTPFPDPPDEP